VEDWVWKDLKARCAKNAAQQQIKDAGLDRTEDDYVREKASQVSQDERD
jgi:hypothetical protein